MPDTDAPSRSEAISPSERVNLPVPVPRPSEVAREPGDSWIHRVLRAMFGWKPNSIRADLEVVLEAGAPGETGFSPEERTMLKNILALRGRRIDDVMVPRADIIAVQQDIALGELIKVFEGAGHSRLVVYNDTLDDPVGMVHIRDVIGYMVRHATVKRGEEREAPKTVSGGPRSQGDRPVGAAVGDEDHPRDPVRSALDAGDRSARQDAGDAHPSRAGHRRIRRHRRHRLDGGHRRADRRRHRGRARRRRHPGRGPAAGRLVPGRCARATWRMSSPSSAPSSTSGASPTRSTRLPATS